MKNPFSPALISELNPVIDSILHRGAALPSPVFLPRLQYFRFLPFEAVLMPEFFNQLISFIGQLSETDFFMVSICPTIEVHLRDFTSGGYFTLDAGDSSSDYLSALHHYPKESRADALACHASRILFSSGSGKWAVLADRDSDLTICGFDTEAIQLGFETVFNDQIFTDVRQAAQYAYDEAGLTDEARALVLNYPDVRSRGGDA